MSYKTLRSLCIDFIIFFIPAALLWLAFPYIWGIFSPFLAGYILFLIARPLNLRFRKKLSPGISAVLSLSFISVVLFVMLKLLFDNLIPEISSVTRSTGEIYAETVPYITGKMSSFTENKEIGKIFSSLVEAFRTQIIKILTDIGAMVIGFAKNIPSMIISLFASVFTAFFFLKDWEIFYAYFKKFFGEAFSRKFSLLKQSFVSVTLSYLKAQFIIESIIFAELLAGFLFLRINYAVILALAAAIVDAVPILGTGTVLIPMSVFYFLSGNQAAGWGLLIIYGVALLTRQLCEPKIIGDKLGIHPLLTVFSLFSGLKLFGIIGLILGPIVAISVKNILKEVKTSFR